MNKVTNEPIIDDYDTLGQTYVISSESILLQDHQVSLACERPRIRRRKGKPNPGLARSRPGSKHRPT